MVASEPTARLGGADASPRTDAPGEVTPIAEPATTRALESGVRRSRVLAVSGLVGACLIGLVPQDSHARTRTGALGVVAPPAPPLLPSLRAAPGLRAADLVAGLGAPLLLGPPPRTTPRRLPGEQPPAAPGTEPTPVEPAPEDMSETPAPSGPGPTGSPLTRPAPTLAPPPAEGEVAVETETETEAKAPAPAPAQDGQIFAPITTTEPKTEPEPEPQEEASRFLKGKSVPPFWIDRTYTTHRTRALTLPPLFFHRTGAANHPEKLFHFNLSLTTGWYSERTAKRRWLSPAILFFGSFSERTSGWGAVALLMGYKRVGEQYSFGQFPFVWRWGNKSVKNLVVVPFHYHQKTPDSLRGFSAVLFWYGHKNTTDKDPLNDLRYFVGFPLFYRVTRGPSTVNVGVPLYLGGQNKARGVQWHTVLPFVHWQSSEYGNRKDLWTLLYVQRSDKARSRRTWAVPPLLTFSRQTPTHKLFSATPLVWRAENRDRGSVAWSVFPWVSYRDPEQRNRVLFPLFWQFGDVKAGVTSSVFVPLVYARKSPQETRVYTLLGGGRSGKNGRWGFGITPLLTFVRNEPGGKSFQVVTPLFGHSHDPSAFGGKGERTLSAAVLGYYRRRGERWDAGFAPLAFVGRDGTRSYQTITPLFWHRRDTDPQNPSDLWVLGPAYAKKVKSGGHGGLAPLVFAGRDDKFRYGIVPPLLFGHVHDVEAQRSRTVSLVFARDKGPDHRTLGVLNLFWDVKRPAGERHTALFPLFYRRHAEGKTLTLTPLGGAYSTPEQRTWSAAALLYGFRGYKDPTRRGFGLIPLIFYDRRKVEGGVASNLVVAPLFARHRAPSEDLDMWSPLVWRTATRGEKPRKNLAVIPFYFRQRQPDGIDVDAGLILPFFYSRDKVRRTHTLIAGPAFHRLTRTSLNAGLVPVYWWHDSAEKRRLISLPLIFHQADKNKLEHTTIAVPLWFDRRRANGRRSWVAFPFVVGVKGQFNFTRFSLTPPIFFDIFRLHKNYRFTGVVPFAFRYQKCGFREEDDDRCRYTLWGSWPLFLYGKDGKGRTSHGALMLYYFDKDPGGRRFLTLLGGANVRPGERLTWYALNFGHTTTRQFKTTVFFPLFFRKAYRTKDRSTTVVLPPLFVGARREDYRWFQAGLMVWNFRRPHKVTTVVAPPLFYTAHSYAERRMTWLLPLFLRDNNWAKDTSFTSVFPALLFQRRRGQDNDWVQFPLVWHIERGENSGTFGAFMWWDIRRKGRITQVVPALWARHRGRGRDVQVLGPGLGWWWRDEQPIRDAQGESIGTKKGLHWRALFGILGGGNDGVQRYFSLFGGRIPLRPKAVWEPRRKRLKAAQPAAPKALPTAAPAGPVAPVEKKP
ncbi:hypothetical protein OV090_32500 [Nannocystis sp. RBIL2]|uniref:hypothetical protein n=1 Tax=Nannocystis sp. RBIL2 TaxID=2996788 RepID=UPI00226E88DC|nr:hypothetical protein [Nannocystis sp. RBIL2]MCY1069507.1 hypothetical protein [Nannocystis sp. RBIL2]